MRTATRALALVAALAAAPAAAAVPVSLDLKVGYALPLGDVSSGVPALHGGLRNYISSSIPIEVAARWRFTPNLSAGIYFQYAPGSAGTFVCTSSYTCSAYVTRVGAEVAWLLDPGAFFSPWISVGTGWEWAGITVNVPDRTDPQGQLVPGGQFKGTMSGWEYANVQIGGEFAFSSLLSAGPWAGFFAGAYSSYSLSGMNTGDGSGQSIPSDLRSFHGWVQFGVKGSVNL